MLPFLKTISNSARAGALITRRMSTSSTNEVGNPSA